MLSISVPWVSCPGVSLLCTLAVLRVCIPRPPHLLVLALLGKLCTMAWRSCWNSFTMEVTPSTSPHSFFNLQKENKQAELNDR